MLIYSNGSCTMLLPSAWVLMADPIFTTIHSPAAEVLHVNPGMLYLAVHPIYPEHMLILKITVLIKLVIKLNINQYISLFYSSDLADIEIQSGLPWEGRVTIQVTPGSANKEFFAQPPYPILELFNPYRVQRQGSKNITWRKIR